MPVAWYHGTMTDDHAMTVRLPAGLYEQLRKAAFDRRISMNEIVAAAVREHLDSQQPGSQTGSKT